MSSFGMQFVSFFHSDPPEALRAPQRLLTQSISSSEVVLVWIDSNSFKTGCQIERSTDSSNYTLVHTSSGNVASWTDSGLSQNTTYYYRLRAYKETSFSGYTTSSVSTPQSDGISLPDAPSNLSATVYLEGQLSPLGERIPAGSVVLSWDLNFNYSMVEVQRSPLNETSWTLLPFNNQGMFFDTPQCGSWKYRIRYVDSGNYSDYSNVAEASVHFIISQSSALISIPWGFFKEEEYGTAWQGLFADFSIEINNQFAYSQDHTVQWFTKTQNGEPIELFIDGFHPPPDILQFTHAIYSGQSNSSLTWMHPVQEDNGRSFWCIVTNNQTGKQDISQIFTLETYSITTQITGLSSTDPSIGDNPKILAPTQHGVNSGTLMISGTGFGREYGLFSFVYMGDFLIGVLSSYNYMGDNTYFVNIPYYESLNSPGYGLYPISVKNPQNSISVISSGPPGVTYIKPPVITSFFPTSVQRGQSLTITGEFTPNSRVVLYKRVGNTYASVYHTPTFSETTLQIIVDPTVATGLQAIDIKDEIGQIFTTAPDSFVAIS